MIEKTYNFTKTLEKIIERIIDDENVAINHMVLNKGQALPEHFSNSNGLYDRNSGRCNPATWRSTSSRLPAGTIVSIPYNVRMNVSNQQEETLEFFVVKAPSPRLFKV